MNLIPRLKFLLIIPFFALLFACDEDPCQGKSCDNGICDTVSGDCLCSKGYQTDADGICTVMWTTKFVKSYTASDSCYGANTGLLSYPLTISSTNAYTLSLDNLNNRGQAITAVHTSSTTFAISKSFANGEVCIGTGSLSPIDSMVRIEYIIGDTTMVSSLDTCFAILN